MASSTPAGTLPTLIGSSAQASGLESSSNTSKNQGSKENAKVVPAPLAHRLSRTQSLVDGGRLRFVDLFVRRPCLVAFGTLVVGMLCLIGLGSVVAKEGSDIISTGSGDDLQDIRTRRRDALEIARKELGGTNNEEEMAAPALTKSGDVLLLVYAASDGDNVFSDAAVRRMKEIEDKITLDSRFPEFCLRADKSGNGTTCRAPLSPTRLFYAAGFDVAATVKQIDLLDGAADEQLSIFQMENLTAILQSIQREVATHMASSSAFTDAGRSEVIAKVADFTGAPLTAVAQAGRLLEMMLPIQAALGGALPLQEKMQDRKSILQLAAAMKGETFFKGLVDYYFDRGFGHSSLRSKHTRAVIMFGRPLAGYTSPADRDQEQTDKLSKWFRSSFRSFLEETSTVGEVEVLYFATPLFMDEFLGILTQDMLLALFAVVFVFICLWAHSGSLFLATVGMMEIILSLPIAFVLYRVVLGLKYFDALNSMTLFVVLAIGADDIFVLMDAYKQSLYYKEAYVDFRTRMTFAYRRAAGAMFVTSFTTMAAFVATATSSLVDVQSFGIFAACVIFVDFALVITWFPACLVLYHNYLESRGCCGCCRRSPGTSTERACAANAAAQDGSGKDTQKRFIERFLGGAFAQFVVKRRIWILVFFVAVLAGAAGAGAQIKPATSTEQFLPSDHPFQRIVTIMDEEFPSSAQDANAKVYLTWGLKDVDRSGVNLLRDFKNKGSVVYDENFAFDEAAQMHLLSICEQVRQYGAEVSGFLSADLDADVLAGKVQCPLFDFKDWLLAANKTFPVHAAQAGDRLADFLKASVPGASDPSQTFKKKWQGMLGVDGETVRFVTIGVESTLREQARHNHDTLKVQYDLFEGWLQKLNAKAPKSASGAIHVASNSMWVWMHTQTVFVKSAITGMITGSVLAFVVVLLTTKQILVALASLVTIVGVLASVLGSMVALGWELGTIESICLTILAGFSVDYVVHLAHAYVHAEKDQRAEKVRSALDEIGVSVLAGMVTSASAAIALMFCQLQFFHKFGVFLILTVLLSWLWANMGFLAAMAAFGPDDSTPEWLQVPAAWIPRIQKYIAEKKYKQDSPVVVEVV